MVSRPELHARPPGHEGAPTSIPRPVSTPARQRRLPLVAIALLAAAGSALAFAVLYASAGDRQPVLAVTRAVDAGATIAAADLAVVQVSVDPRLAPLPATEQPAVVGQPAAVDLLPGTLLTQAHVGAASPVGPGQAMVGLALQPGAVPSSHLRAGDRVQVIESLSPGDPGGQAASRLGWVLAEGQVWGVQALEDGSGTVVVSLIVDERSAPAVASTAAADRASLVLVAP